MANLLVPFVVVFVMLLTACQAPTNITPTVDKSITPVATVDLALTPEPGKASVIGRIMTRDTNQPYANVIVRLAPVVDLGTDEEDAFALDEARSPGTISDESGYFAFSSIEPGDYVLIFGNISTIYVIPTSTPDHAIVVKLMQDQVTNIGELQIKFPE